MSEIQRNLVGKVALVTGSGRGIGAAIALRLAVHGADVVINYVHSAAAAEEVAAKARREHGVRAICIQADVSNKEDIGRLFQTAIKEMDHLDIVMSNSGIEHFNSLENTTEEEIDKTFAVNVKAQYFVAQQCSKYMADNGRLILISSISAVKGIPRHAIYAASKAAIMGMVKCLAYDLGTRGITVNAIAPGGIKSDMYAQYAKDYLPNGDSLTIEEIDEITKGWSPMNRLGYPDDVAGVVALLSSSESQWLTGQTLQVGGGAAMS